MIKINDKNQIVIYPVLTTMQNGEISMFTTIVSLKEIGEIYHRLTYDGNAQRGYVDNGKNKEKMINKTHVQSIKNAILDGENIHGDLVWNIRKFDDLDDLCLDYYEYDSARNTLTIIGNTITLPDSAHRHEAIYEIYKGDKENEILDNELVLNIYHLSFKDEKNLFVNINSKGKTPEYNRILFLSNDIKCQLIRDVMKGSDLKDRVETVKRIPKGNKITKFSSLYDSIFGTAAKGKGAFNSINITKK